MLELCETRKPFWKYLCNFKFQTLTLVVAVYLKSFEVCIPGLTQCWLIACILKRVCVCGYVCADTDRSPYCTVYRVFDRGCCALLCWYVYMYHIQYIPCTKTGLLWKKLGVHYLKLFKAGSWIGVGGRTWFSLHRMSKHNSSNVSLKLKAFEHVLKNY